MMPAANNGLGMNFGFPDVCLTPAGPIPVPIPYPNMALNVMAVPFSPNVFTGFMPALNMSAKEPMTLGDQPGCINPLFMQAGQYTLGNPMVFVNCMPAVNMLCPTSGNMMNDPLGAVLVPSITTTFYNDREALEQASTPTLSVEQLTALSEAVVPTPARQGDEPTVRGRWLAAGVAAVEIRRFAAGTATRVFNALHKLGRGEIVRLVIDLRGNPGGDVHAALELADDFVPRGTVLALRDDGTDCFAVKARHAQAYPWPLEVEVDHRTASAAELFAGALQACARASVHGGPTAGKGTVQQVQPSRGDGAPQYRTVARFLLPNGRPIDGRGITSLPDAT